MYPVLSASENVSARGKDLGFGGGMEVFPVLQGLPVAVLEAYQDFINSIKDGQAFVKGEQAVDLAAGEVTSLALSLQERNNYLHK